MIKYCGMALCALAAILVLRGAKSEFASLVGTAASVILFGAAMVSFIPVFEFARDISEDAQTGEYLGTIVKALGVSLSVQFASEICRDVGEPALASKLELIGKAEIMLLCIPLIRELIVLASELISA